MMPLYTMLAGQESGDMLMQIPTLVVGIFAVILLIAFCIGLKKGFRLVSWKGCFWAFACLTYYAIKLLLARNNVLLAFMQKLGLSQGIAVGASYVLVAFFSIFLSLALSAIFKKAFRPKKRLIKKDADRFLKDENGVEYDPEETDYDDYEKYENTQIVEKVGYGKPNFFGRLFGGFACLLNTAMVLFAVFIVIVFMCVVLAGFVPQVQVVLDNVVIQRVKPFVLKNGLDFLLIGILMNTARKGYKKGFVESLRVLFVKIGKFMSVLIAFYLPFSNLAVASEGGGVALLSILNERFTNLAVKLSLPAMIAPMMGKILCGVCLCVVLLLIVALLNLALKKIADGIENVGFFRKIDGALACATYAVIGLLLCCLICIALYMLVVFNIVNIFAYIPEGGMAYSLLQMSAELINPVLTIILPALG